MLVELERGGSQLPSAAGCGGPLRKLLKTRPTSVGNERGVALVPSWPATSVARRRSSGSGGSKRVSRLLRSEERRVGKEGRSWRAPHLGQKKTHEAVVGPRYRSSRG